MPAERLRPALLWLGLPLLLALARQAWVMGRALQIGLRSAQATRVFEARPAAAQARVLLVGDSTGVGVGAGRPQATLAGLLAAEYPNLEIVNRSRNGARVADTARRLQAMQASGEHFDLVLLLVGGNDALRLTPLPQLAADTGAMLQALKAVATRCIWLGCADIGGSPLLPPPLSWCMRWQTGRTVQLLRSQAQAHGVQYIDFFTPADDDEHARLAGTCFAEDGLHPSADGYRHCFESLKRQVVLPGAYALRRTPPQETLHAQCV